MSRDEDLAAQIERAEAEFAALEQARAQTLARLAVLRAAGSPRAEPPQLRLPMTTDVPAPRSGAAKVRLFSTLFRGRTDVFPKRWENVKQERSGYAPACANEWVRGVCEKPKVKCGECPNQAFIAVEDRVIADHLGGKYTAGVYPLLRDDTCWFVALDFDEESWTDDVAAFVETCRGHSLSPAVERSRSGNGAHVWFFFTAPVPARDARDMASFLLTETMRLRRELKLESYDRLFPSQDTLPQGGFGNLIALPFQFHPRKLGHSLFVDSHFEAFPWEQQWQFLAAVERLEPDRVCALAKEAVRTQYAGRIQRLHPGKREVRIYDYVDRNVPVLDRMFRRRLAGYRSIGYFEGELPPGYGEADDDWALGRGWVDGLGEDDPGEISSLEQ